MQHIVHFQELTETNNAVTIQLDLREQELKH